MKWISVKEQLPKKDQRVLICDDDDIYTAYFGEPELEKQFMIDNGCPRSTKYWMPLPELPKD